jgi:hypothetical protein|tara:strand:+ start:1005 stop:1229 length:225 start_codon:yes stop_codon:yes gene_type:complete
MMDLILVFMVSVGSLFGVDNQEFFETVEEQVAQGAKWHYVGKSPLDPNAKSIPAQTCDDVCDEPYILWKLKLKR